MKPKTLMTFFLTVVAAGSAWSQSDSAMRPAIRVLDFPEVINAVLADFPSNLRHIAGDLVLAQGEFEDYASLVVMPGAASCTVTRWHSWEDSTASWQAKMFRSDDFAMAAGEYHALFQKLQHCYVRLVDGSIINLTGDWESPKDGVPFATCTLRLATGDERYKEVMVQLELAYQLADWAVNINIVSKRPDDEVGSKAVDSNGQ
jgi:hypothetical protein